MNADEARKAHERSGKFKKGHAKIGGRKRGTSNLLTADYKKRLLEAAYRIGNDGNGADGVVGYLRWVALYHSRASLIQLSKIIVLEHYLGEMPNEPCRTAEEINREICGYIGLSNTNPNAGPNNAVRDDSIANMVPGSRLRCGKSSSQQDWDWTGRNDEIGILMRLAVEEPKSFCKLLGQVFLTVPKNMRRTGRCH